MIKFAESFRLHADMAEFLRREIYRAGRHRLLLAPARHPAAPYAHARSVRRRACSRRSTRSSWSSTTRRSSQLRNPFEQALITPVLEALADARPYNLDPEHGLGVVVPHRAQRAALREGIPALTRRDPATGR